MMKNDNALAALRAANTLCKELLDVAAREGRRADWKALTVKLQGALAEQDAALHPRRFK